MQEKSKIKKKKWDKPKLIVLVRDKPEEGALLCCKRGYSVEFEPNSIVFYCTFSIPEEHYCARCMNEVCT